MAQASSPSSKKVINYEPGLMKYWGGGEVLYNNNYKIQTKIAKRTLKYWTDWPVKISKILGGQKLKTPSPSANAYGNE